MRMYRTNAVILRKYSFGEADKFVTVYTQNYGKQTILAKGIRKITSKRAPVLEMFNLVTLMIGKSTHTNYLVEGELIDSFSEIKLDLRTISKAYEFCEIISLLTPENQIQEDIFNLLVEFLTKLKFGDVDVNEYKLQLLILLGYHAKGLYLSAHVDDYVEELAQRKLLSKRLYE